jgi:hypothetical protein
MVETLLLDLLVQEIQLFAWNGGFDGVFAVLEQWTKESCATRHCHQSPDLPCSAFHAQQVQKPAAQKRIAMPINTSIKQNCATFPSTKWTT